MPAVQKKILSDAQRTALTRIVTVHQGRIRAFLCRFESDLAVIDELTQDVFIGVLSHCEELARSSEEEVAKYLRGVARNLVRLRWRKRQSGTFVAIRDILEHELEERHPDDCEGRTRALSACLDRLSDRSRALVTRHFFEGLSIVQLARELHQSDASLRMILFRIRRQLRLCMETRLKEGLTS